MKKKRFRAALAVALVAAAGLCSYETYQDYKADKESDLVMQNIEVLTDDDTSSSDWYLHNFKCEFEVTSEAQANAIVKFLGISASVGAKVNLSNATQYFNHEKKHGFGPCERGDQVTCNDILLLIASKI